MARSSWKTPFVDPSLLAAMENQSSAGSMKNKKAVLKTQSRQSMILPSFVGKTFIQVHVREEMVGHRLGEYANTRKPGTHPTKGKKKK